MNEDTMTTRPVRRKEESYWLPRPRRGTQHKQLNFGYAANSDRHAHTHCKLTLPYVRKDIDTLLLGLQQRSSFKLCDIDTDYFCI